MGCTHSENWCRNGKILYQNFLHVAPHYLINLEWPVHYRFDYQQLFGRKAEPGGAAEIEPKSNNICTNICQQLVLDHSNKNFTINDAYLLLFRYYYS